MAALLLAGAVLGAVSSIQQGQAQKKANRFNAKMLDLQAKRTRIATTDKVTQFRQESGRIMETIKSQSAASGVRMTGTPLEVLAESAVNAELDALNLQFEGDMESARLKLEARHQRRAGTGAARAGVMGGASSIIGGIAGAQ